MRSAFATFLIALGAVFAQVAPAQQPNVPGVMRVVVPFGPGGSNDVIARAMSPLLAKQLGNNVIIENRAGASGAIGANLVAKGPRDGSLLLLTSSTLVTAAAITPSTPYDVSTAFAPVAMVGQGPLLLAVSAATPIKSPADLVAAARARPDALTYGTAGIGSIAHMATEMLNDTAKIQLRHVPYKGAADSLLDLASGRIDIMISNYSSLLPQIKAGRVRLIAVTSRLPAEAFPDLPALAGVAPGYAADVWVCVFAPAGTPAALVNRLNGEIIAVAAAADVRSLLVSDGTVPASLPPAEVARLVREDLARWKHIATEKKIVAE
jgi:tripartite-type tricarboxylate transporter receptor subunit TctC